MTRKLKLQPIKEMFADQDLYIGIDVHLKSWSVCILTATRVYRSFTQPPEPSVLIDHLHRHFPGARYHCVYEAGYFGFSAARALNAAGVECIVVHPADVPQSDYERRNKSDRIDAQKLACALRGNNLKAIYIPEAEMEQDRALLRAREDVVTKQSRVKHQIRAYLKQHAVPFPLSESGSPRSWSRAVIAKLAKIALPTHSGTRTLQLYVKELLFHREQLLEITREIRALSRTARYAENVELLCSCPGIGMLTAMALLTELVDIRRFPNANRLAKYIGLIPDEESSGDTKKTKGVSKRRNAHLRHKLIESAWVAARTDPALIAVYERACRRMKKQRAIIVVARKLLNRLRAVLLRKEKYQMGMTAIVASEDTLEHAA
jgi:transposase